jgi:hypothetical protein
MNPTDEVRPETFFAEFLLPLSQANKRRGVRYLESSRDAASYWGPVLSRTGGIERIAAAAEGDRNLTRLAPFLASLREALAKPEAAPEAKPGISDFVYPMF